MANQQRRRLEQGEGELRRLAESNEPSAPTVDPAQYLRSCPQPDMDVWEALKKTMSTHAAKTKAVLNTMSLDHGWSGWIQWIPNQDRVPHIKFMGDVSAACLHSQN